jgi:hypothetical protein
MKILITKFSLVSITPSVVSVKVFLRTLFPNMAYVFP